MSDTRLSPQATLELPDSATAAEAGCAFLRLLERAEFVPSSLQVQALNALCRISVPVDESEARKHEAAEVSAFAAEYWSLPPRVRRARWESLCVWCVSHSRLRELEAGLDVEVTQLENADANELAVLFRELFVLPRRERAIRRTQWLAEEAASALRWREAVTRVTHTASVLLTLDHTLANCLKPEFELALFDTTVKSAATQKRKSASLQGYEQAESDLQLYTSSQPSRAGRPRQYSNMQSSTGSNNEVGITFVVLVALLISTLSFFARCNQTQPPVTNKDYYPPKTNTVMPAATPSGNKSERDVEDQTLSIMRWQMYINYEQEVIRMPQMQPPYGYDIWVRAGRPKPTFEKPRP
jgi:hypothetical protein